MTPEEIYDRFGEKMFHYAALRLGSPEDAEDVLQETFFRLSSYPIRWAFIRSPKAFIFRMLQNETNRFLRKRISRLRLDSLKPKDEGRISDALSDPDTRIFQSLAALPEDQREVVLLKVFEDLSFKEIAAVCGLSVNTAASRYRYGLEKLRALLAREK